MDEVKSRSVIIIGCGNIAGGFDVGLTDEANPCTHAGAYIRDGRFELVGCVDPDNIKLGAFMEYWRIEQGFSSVEEAIDSGLKAEVISICSPTENHRKDVLDSLKFQPKIIFCEKPVTETCSATKELLDACLTHKVRLMINHTRRWDPSIQKLKEDIESHKYGKLRSLVGYYNKGILNNGSHLLDILLYLFEDLEIIAVGEKDIDYNKRDPTIGALLKTRDQKLVHIVTGNAKDFSFFELQFVFELGVLVMYRGGQSWGWRDISTSERFDSYLELNDEKLLAGTYDLAMSKAIENIYDFLMFRKSIKSTVETALKAQQFCEQITHFKCK